MFPGSIRVYVSKERVDLRKSYDGLGLLIQDSLEMDPLSGFVFVFFNKTSDKMKALYWDRNGFFILQKKA
jgi:transposase